MKVTIYSTKGRVKIADMPIDGVADLVDALNRERPRYLQFNLDGTGTTYINRDQITRIDVDEPDTSKGKKA